MGRKYVGAAANSLTEASIETSPSNLRRMEDIYAVRSSRRHLTVSARCLYRAHISTITLDKEDVIRVCITSSVITSLHILYISLQLPMFPSRFIPRHYIL